MSTIVLAKAPQCNAVQFNTTSISFVRIVHIPFVSAHDYIIFEAYGYQKNSEVSKNISKGSDIRGKGKDTAFTGIAGQMGTSSFHVPRLGYRTIGSNSLTQQGQFSCRTVKHS